MATYIEVAQALASSGYLSDADIEAAADVLEDALIVAAAEEAEDEASDNYTTQEEIIAETENWASEDALAGDFAALEDDQDIIADALDREGEDMEVMVTAEAAIDAAYLDAASALLAAELIDEVNLDNVAAVIADVWIVEEE
jgi:hypothetical protein